jgi:hypothetical protein
MPLFRVPHFVAPQEVAELLPYLPVADVPRELLGKLNTMERHLPSNIGLPLLRKMHDFVDQSNRTYQANSAALDTCHERVAHQHDFKYSTLYQIASILLPEAVRKAEGPKALSSVLYAVHRALLRRDAGFTLPAKRPSDAGGYLEVLPKDDLLNIERVRDIVREYVSSKLTESLGSPPPERNLLCRFVRKAQQHIDFSRKTRSFTDYGTISPISVKPEFYSDLGQVEAFDGDDRMFIKFLELWVGLGVFQYSSTLDSIGVAILRAIGRYDDAAAIHHRAGWTLLQEIGIIPPWAIRQSFKLRLPNTGLRLSALPSEVTTGFVPDKLKGMRQDWGDLPVYCIDDSGAHEIDDGLSIEAADTPGEYWLHIHTADPGAHIDPSGAAAKYAEAFVGNVYMPDRVLSMLSSNYVQANLSLAKNRPCLTYSAKMNTGGELLDYKITPGIVRNVLHITKRTVYEAILKSPYPLKTLSHAVGQNMTQSIRRHMNHLQELSDHDKESLTLLHLIGKALTKQRTARGGYSPPGHKPSISVSTSSIERSSNGISTYYHGDPSIQVLTTTLGSSDPVALENEFLDVVGPLMLLAGEVGARWCNDRGIPVFYRLTPRHEDGADPGEYFLKHVLPKIDKRGDWDDAVAQSYFKLIGAAQSSSSPGPHMSIGVEMFARCTSPLRRYSDLVLQWQVEASILEEARLGKSLVGNTKQNFLPFSKARIDALIPYLHDKEKITGISGYASTSHWLTLFLLRSQVYGQAKIPKTFSLVVKTIKPVFHEVRGMLGHFQTGVRAQCDICPVTEIEVGDILEVEPDEIDTFRSYTLFRVIRRLNQSEKEALDRENMLMMDSQEII